MPEKKQPDPPPPEHPEHADKFGYTEDDWQHLEIQKAPPPASLPWRRPQKT